MLRPILEARGLWNCADTPASPASEARHADYSFLRSSADPQAPDTIDRDSMLKDTGIPVRACDSLEDAELLRNVLDDNKIQSIVITTKRGYPVRFPEIIVFPEDVDRATGLLDHADLQALRDSAERETGPTIEGSSTCPHCGSTEIMLQPPRPDCLNVWLCCDCSRSWQDNLPADWPAGS